jgi:hypothetical protein
MMAAWLTSLTGGRTIEMPCTVDIEQTAESLHAYVEIDEIEIRPGDRIIVHDAPTHVAFGEHIVCSRRVTIVRAGLIDNLLARLEGYLELTELYEVSFSDGRAS